MLDNLLDIEVAYSLLRGGTQDNENDPIDINYEKLKTKIEVRLPPPLSFQNNINPDYCLERLCSDGFQHVVYLFFHRLLTRPQKRLISLCNMSRTPTLLHTTLIHWKCKK